MRRRILITTSAIAFALSIAMRCFAADPCLGSLAGIFNKCVSQTENRHALIDALANYRQYGIKLGEGKYELRNSTDTELIIDATTQTFDGTFSFKVEAGDEVIISGIRIASSATPDGKTIFTISGAGRATLANSSVSGSTKNICLETSSPSATIDGDVIKGCDTGIKVSADDVKIINSEVSSNSTNGILISPGIQGTDIEHSKVYANANNIKFAGTAPAQVTFFDSDPNEAGKIQSVAWADNVAYSFASRPIYMDTPIDSNSSGTVKVEFFLTDETIGGAIEPIDCADGGKNLIELQASQLFIATGHCQIDAKYLETPIIAMYTDPVYGTTGFTRRFKSAAGGVVIFVDSPFDMPTSGMDGPATINAEQGSDAEIDSTATVAGAGAGSTGTSKGCGAILVPVEEGDTALLAIAMSWIIPATAPLCFARLTIRRRR